MEKFKSNTDTINIISVSSVIFKENNRLLNIDENSYYYLQKGNILGLCNNKKDNNSIVDFLKSKIEIHEMNTKNSKNIIISFEDNEITSYKFAIIDINSIENELNNDIFI